jgi:hypothetical protein
VIQVHIRRLGLHEAGFRKRLPKLLFIDARTVHRVSDPAKDSWPISSRGTM